MRPWVQTCQKKISWNSILIGHPVMYLTTLSQSNINQEHWSWIPESWILISL
jgi:hypothetical protein